eukprot:m.334422 g.334422  ORF g.334422 m.334422 type:complete len:109 (+) comp16527_c0_seq21:330-656(+)
MTRFFVWLGLMSVDSERMWELSYRTFISKTHQFLFFPSVGDIPRFEPTSIGRDPPTDDRWAMPRLVVENLTLHIAPLIPSYVCTTSEQGNTDALQSCREGDCKTVQNA